MKANYKPYDLEDSVSRIDEILKAKGCSYEEKDIIPPREKLKFTNGFYVNCSALFVDIRKSSELTASHQKRVLAKLYRAYISEVVAVINGNSQCKELNVVGDCVSGIFHTQHRSDVDEVFYTAAQVSSLIDILNYKLKRNKIKGITVGIGIALGRTLMIKAGYEGSGINEVVWMGDAVNEASKLASQGNKQLLAWKCPELMVSNYFYDHLTGSNQKKLEKNIDYDCYQGKVFAADMKTLCKQKCTG
ncbi:MAG: adenylate/guanylate cyclase domain-containing protein [Candidatus Bathyarchaeota archaeon]|nr:adenylate/guanylate cyclase domain-containing protein [Candidatus Termiticorpusculum sp.]